MSRDLVSLTLGALERQEAGLLGWGIIDIALTEKEVVDTILGEADSVDVYVANPHEVLDDLIRRGLLVHVEGRTPRYRTRMAETVRLMASLRQLFFPKAARAEEWREGPRLVRDYRFDVRPRRYPRRDIPADTLIETAESLGRPATTVAALRALLLGRDGTGARLAGFQRRAGEAILAGQGARDTARAGLVITAGTGSGKTLAFYAPALAEIAGLVATDGRPSLKAIAIYPRNELLKDQLGEVLRLTRAIGTSISGRPIRVGAYYGDVPVELSQHRTPSWNRAGDGWRCPYIRCPTCSHESLVWRPGRGGLQCSRQCEGRVDEQELALSRREIQRSPVDILFTSTEMLNRALARSWDWPAFGISEVVGPRFVLLDEIHTYGGLHGAGVAMLLRRYKSAVRGPLYIAGLSATLRDARAFFSTLTGINASRIVHAEAQDDELTEEGAEYQLALRSDPVSGASVLSTSIQALMLLRRVLDPWESAPSGGAYGRRVFAFSDTLDGVNRLLPDLLDAEGRTKWDQPSQRHPEGSLANIRARTTALQAGDYSARDRDGQVWGMVEDLGHQLSGAEMRISRTTSQDTGVDQRADVVLATASLDVGYNDPEVGAVLQHKAPRSASQLLQRRGRAGRAREMRPWTVVVLSDFGRDRSAYQGYEHLFDPTLEPQPLPIGNRHVLKMQAAYSLLDWLERSVSGRQRGSSWRELAGARSDPVRVTAMVGLLRETLEGGKARERLQRHLEWSLDLSEREMLAVLWSPPRALIATVIPTALRRLETDWQSFDPASGGQEGRDEARPLPEFIPRALFESLNTPDVRIDAPQHDAESLSIEQALTEFCPGNVSRRFAVRGGQRSHWIAVDPGREGHQVIDISTWCEDFDELGAYGGESESGESVRCVRPRRLRLDEVPPGVSDSSGARLSWRTEISGAAQPAVFDLAVGPTWGRLFSRIAFHTHGVGAAVEVRRYARYANASVLSGRQRREVTVDFVLEGESVGLGYAIDADAICLDVVMPDGLVPRPDESGEYARAFRRAWFVHRVRADDRLASATGGLGRERLADLYLSALTAEALSSGTSLHEARAAVAADLKNRLLAAAAETHWREDGVPEETDDEVPSNQTGGGGPWDLGDAPAGLVRLRELLDARPDVLSVVDELSSELSGALPAAAVPWARERYLLTVAASVRAASQQLCSEVDLDDTSIDLVHSPAGLDDGPVQVWITELAVGGSGAIEAVRLRSRERPRRFLSLIRAALAPSDLELADAQVTRTLALAQESPVREALALAREALGGGEALSSVRERLVAFFSVLASERVSLTPTGRVAIGSRFFRAGTGLQSDQVLLKVTTRWRALEERLGLDISLSAMSYALSGEGGIDRLLSAAAGAPPPAVQTQAWRMGVLSMLLWPRGGTLRAGALEASGRFTEAPPTDRLAVVGRLPSLASSIDLSDSDWRVCLQATLSADGEARLTSEGHPEIMKGALLDLMVEPIESGFLQVFPRLDGLSDQAGFLTASLSLRELDA